MFFFSLSLHIALYFSHSLSLSFYFCSILYIKLVSPMLYRTHFFFSSCVCIVFYLAILIFLIYINLLTFHGVQCPQPSKFFSHDDYIIGLIRRTMLYCFNRIVFNEGSKALNHRNCQVISL